MSILIQNKKSKYGFRCVAVKEKHGRLVDANEVKEQLIKYGFKAPDMTVTEFVEDCLETIIEAEE